MEESVKIYFQFSLWDSEEDIKSLTIPAGETLSILFMRFNEKLRMIAYKLIALSILFMRFIFIRNKEVIKKKWAFNSLYEIQEMVKSTKWNYWKKLSILFMRFKGFYFKPFFKPYFTFNSLYEIQYF